MDLLNLLVKRYIYHFWVRLNTDTTKKVEIITQKLSTRFCFVFCCLNVHVFLRSASLRSRGCFLVVNGSKNKLYLWQGFKACKATIERAQQASQNLKTSVLDLHKKTLDVVEVMEGDENDAFWDTLGDEEDYMSYIEGTFFVCF